MCSTLLVSCSGDDQGDDPSPGSGDTADDGNGSLPGSRRGDPTSSDTGGGRNDDDQDSTGSAGSGSASGPQSGGSTVPGAPGQAPTFPPTFPGAGTSDVGAPLMNGELCDYVPGEGEYPTPMEVSRCFFGPDNPVPAATLEQVLECVEGQDVVHIRLTFNPDFVDNTYGENAMGWAGRGHDFNDLVGSDHAEIVMKDEAGNVILQFKIDYITQDPSSPSGYGTLGVSGGDGNVTVGDAALILDTSTSMDRNFRRRPTRTTRRAQRRRSGTTASCTRRGSTSRRSAMPGSVVRSSNTCMHRRPRPTRTRSRSSPATAPAPIRTAASMSRRPAARAAPAATALAATAAARARTSTPTRSAARPWSLGQRRQRSVRRQRSRHDLRRAHGWQRRRPRVLCRASRRSRLQRRLSARPANVTWRSRRKERNMRLALVLAVVALSVGCGGDDGGSDDDDRGDGGAQQPVTWNCTCWSLRATPGATRSTEPITHCSASDPTDMLSERYANGAEELGLMGGCEPCAKTETTCTPQP
jgi:hypothetical protein